MKNKSSKKIPQELANKVILMSLTDTKGKIKFINQKFSEVSGWKISELLGKDHCIMNSGIHNSDFWLKMYETTKIKKRTWHSIVVNKAKNGKLFYVDLYIIPNFSSTGKFLGWSSIGQDITQTFEIYREIDKKNAYLEYAAKLIRHDMHSGINVYIPRGLSILRSRIDEKYIEELGIGTALKLLEDGLKQTQLIYEGAKEFTNIVKRDSKIEKNEENLKDTIKEFLSGSSYRENVFIENIGTALINKNLFCIAIDNLIKNGLSYNDSEKKEIKIFRQDDDIFIQDNGRGMTPDEFNYLRLPYTRKKEQNEHGQGLGLNICQAIIEEHGFKIDCQIPENNIGTIIRIRLKND